MKKIFKKGFTYVELIVVITIISIVWIWSFFGFRDFLENQKYNSEIAKISEFIKEKDLNIKNKNNFDYEIYFSKNNNYFFGYENIFDKKENIIFKDDKFIIKNLENISENINIELEKLEKEKENFENDKKTLENQLIWLSEEDKKAKEIKIKDKEGNIKINESLIKKLENDKNNFEENAIFVANFYKNNKIIKSYNIFINWIDLSEKDKEITKNCENNNFYCLQKNISLENFQKINFSELWEKNWFYELKTKNHKNENLNNFFIYFLWDFKLKNIKNWTNNTEDIKIENIWWKKNFWKKVEFIFENKDWKDFNLIIKK